MKNITEQQFLKENLKNNTISGHDSKLKNLVVNYVGNAVDPDSEEVTVEHIIEVFAKEFPEFLLVVAEENWISGYSQALEDTEYMKSENKENVT